MNIHTLIIFFLTLFCLLHSNADSERSLPVLPVTIRRILHQPLFPDDNPAPNPPPPSVIADPNEPFFPSGSNPNPDSPLPPPPPPPPPALTVGPTTEKPKPAKRVLAVAISVGIVTVGILSGLAFFIYRHKRRHTVETHKLVGGAGANAATSEPPVSRRSVTVTVGDDNIVNGSPYRKLNSGKRLDRYRPSPELHPLPPLSKTYSPVAVMVSSSDDECRESTYYTPHGSVASSTTDESFWASISRSSSKSNGSSFNSGSKLDNQITSYSNPNFTNPKRSSSPRSRFFESSIGLDIVKHAIIPSIKSTPPLPPPPPPRPPVAPEKSILPTQVKSASHPPPPPPPPLPPPRAPQKVYKEKGNGSSQLPPKPQFPTQNARKETVRSSEVSDIEDDMEESRPKLKALHWDKVKATSDRATVWDQLKSSSFQINEDMMESLFGFNSSANEKKETTKKSVLPPVEKEDRVLDPKKSQNIAILLRALNVTRDEVIEGLLDGNPEGLGADLLETLVKMAPTKEEEIKLKDYNGDISKLGSAERFLKGILDIPFAFKRVEAMLYRANFDTEVKYLRKSFETLEIASEEVKNSRLFLKLLEAVLQTGNRMNVGTNRGAAKAFKLDTLLKLVDIKGTDGKTTLLHFVVQEITRSEGSNLTAQTLPNQMSSAKKEEVFKKQGLHIVSGLSRELSHVRSAAGMDSDVLSSYVSKLEIGLEKVRMVSQYENPETQGRFFESMKKFLKEAEEEIARVRAHERKALARVRDVTAYFHGDTSKEEAHPLRIFLIVRDFLSVLDNVCKEVGRTEDRSVMGTAKTFRVSTYQPLPPITKFNLKRSNESSGDESMSSGS